MPTPPSVEQVQDYLTSIDMDSWAANATAVGEALAEEVANQKMRCRFPADPEAPAEPLAWPDDLRGALLRRVARNLSLRPLPLGMQPTVTDGVTLMTRVGGLDAEIRAKEAPHRKVVKG